jgi:hypothetical protein
MSKKKNSVVDDEKWYQSWDKSSIAAMIANALTFITLMYTCKQNDTSDKRYFENDSTGRIEQNRVSIRDSAQTTLLIQELTEQRNENKRLRVRDSIDLSLYREQINNLNLSIKGQYQLLEIQRLASKSDLTFKINFRDIENAKYGGLMLADITLQNTGKTRAEDISIDFLFIFENVLRSESSYGYSFSRAEIYNTRLSPDSSKYIQQVFPYSEGFFMTDEEKDMRNREIGQSIMKMLSETEALSARNPSKKEWNQNFYKNKRETDALQEKYPNNPYSLYLITHISYRDKFLNKYDELYITNRINQYERGNDFTSFRVEPIDRKKLPKFRKAIQRYRFDYKKILEASAYTLE